MNEILTHEMVFEDLAPVEVPVKIGNRNYILKEANQEVAKNYRNTLMKATKFGPNGMPIGSDGLADAEAVLVAGCLFESYGTPEQPRIRPVTLSTILGWKPKIVGPLFERAQAISGLRDQLTEETLQGQIDKLQAAQKALQEQKAAQDKAGVTPENVLPNSPTDGQQN